jgi:anti-sigma B factor antagonist
MKISARQMNGITIVDCGRITLGEGSVILKDVVGELLSRGQNHVLLNLGNVNSSTAPESANWSVP